MEDATLETKTKDDNTKPKSAGFTPSPKPSRRIPGLGMIKTTLARLPQVYIVEYIIYLVASGSLIAIAIYLWNSIISSVGSDPSGALLGDSFAYTTSIGIIAAILILLPALLWLQGRNHHLEEQAPQIKNHKWRKGFLAVFLLIIGLSAISATIGLLQGLLTALSSVGLKTSDNQPVLWKSIVTQSFNIVLLVSTAAIYARDYRHNDDANQNHIAGRKSLLNKSLAIIVGVLLIAFIAIPFRKQRNSYVDNVISEDVSAILSKLQTTNKNKIDSVEDVDVSKDIKARAKKYNYTISSSGTSKYSSTYKVCAEFKTDTSERHNRDNYIGLSSILSLSKPSTGISLNSDDDNDTAPADRAYPANSNPYVHGKGKQCFRSYAYSSPVEDRYNEDDSSTVN